MCCWDWDYYLVMEVINLHDAIGDESDHKYHVSIEAVSPESAGNENLDRAFARVVKESNPCTKT
jgi:hypothetical protein